MSWLFGQTWIWILIAFILVLVIGFLAAQWWRKKAAVAEPAAQPGSAKPETSAEDTDTPAVGMPAQPAGDGGSGLSAAESEADTGRIPAQSATAVAVAVADGGTTAEDSPYGPGSALPLSGGAAPSAEYTVKGNTASMLFHTADSPYYPRTRAEVWFRSAADAESAGFTAWNRRR